MLIMVTVYSILVTPFIFISIHHLESNNPSLIDSSTSEGTVTFNGWGLKVFLFHIQI